jgi:hypothetical protein
MSDPEKSGKAYSSNGVVVIDDEAELFANPLPIVGHRKTTTRREIWVSLLVNWYKPESFS